MDVGSRVKRVRHEKGLTLKAVESLSGVSATHLSEIERGETSPTLGSLARIARALSKPTAYFLEDNELGPVSRVGAKDRVREAVKGSARRGTASIERLTAGVPGGRLHARRVELPPGSEYRAERHAHAGFEAMLVLDGRVRVDAGEQSFDLAEGDAIHFDASLPHAYANASRDEAAALIWVATRRDVD
ncbi:MAG TPA: XRE family transcriptional regulator [Candidatus Krumholzibacteria bacterium]|nr:XRE family transcriptional regulator [Candidatus Krumholzibacteria bacterium]